MLEAASAWEDAVYNMNHLVKTLALEINDRVGHWKPRPPAMAAGLTDHRRRIKEILTTVVVPQRTNNTQQGDHPQIDAGEIAMDERKWEKYGWILFALWVAVTCIVYLWQFWPLATSVLALMKGRLEL